MKRVYILFSCLALFSTGYLAAQAIAPYQGPNTPAVSNPRADGASFYKGALLVSISEGSTTANYSTSNSEACRSHTRYTCKMDGVRDPLFIEYGITNRWGIGVSSGNDLFSVNSQDYYGFKTADNKALNVKTSEFTFDLNYHIYSGRHIDWSVYSSVGSFGVSYNAIVGENTNYQYNAKGGIFRMGSRVRYYFGRRFGVLAMLSSYSAYATPKTASPVSEIKSYSTSIKGTAIEFGLCYRFF